MSIVLSSARLDPTSLTSGIRARPLAEVGALVVLVVLVVVAVAGAAVSGGLTCATGASVAAAVSAGFTGNCTAGAVSDGDCSLAATCAWAGMAGAITATIAEKIGNNCCE